jgi:hypothetical protein
MKLRIHEESVRVRLTQSEVARLAAGQSVEQTTTFAPSTQLVSAVRTASGVANVHATFEDGCITLWIPATRAREWALSEEVGIYATADTGDGRVLSLLIEKDFQCLHPKRGETEDDAFPNPNAR